MNLSRRCAWAGLAACLTLAGPAPAADPVLNKESAREYLDARTKAWLGWGPAAKRAGGETRCISCHSAVPMALARPNLGPATAPEKDMVANVRARVKDWDR